MSEKKIIFKLSKIKKEYNAQSKNSYSVLKDISLTIFKGDSIAIQGPSGSGKSTLLNIIGTLDQASDGELFFENKNITSFSSQEIAFFRNQKIGFIFQLHHLLPQCSVLENILLPTIIDKSTSQKDKKQNALSLLNYVNLSDKIHNYPAQLSGGELLRVTIARALINNPSILLADEPTGSLDKKTAADIADLLLKLNQEKNMTLLVVTHSTTLANRLNSRYYLENGYLKDLS